MRKRSLSVQALTTKDWMPFRPYDRFTPYDGYYLKQANAIFDFLNKPSDDGLRHYFEREHLKVLAILITCYFEDFINDIGLWRTLVRKYKELYGYALPFFDLDDYDPDYLNYQDFAYLIWHYLGRMTQKSLNPYSPGLLQVATFCYDYFEQRIEEAPGTGFYDDWLNIGPDIPFFDLKTRLKWMAFDNYLTGPEFTQAMLHEIEEMADKNTRLFEKMEPGKLIYALEEGYLYKRSSSWGALTAPDWLAEVARCPDELRPDIRRLSQRVNGTFLYEGCDEHHYHFRFIRSNRLFHIQRKSVDLDTENMHPGAETGFFGIVNWRGDWWLSGTYMGWPVQADQLDELRVDPKGVSFYGWTESDQQKIRETSADMEAGFITYFGDRLVLFANSKEMAAAMDAQRLWWNEQLTKKTGRTLPAKSKQAELLAKKSPDLESIDFGGRGSLAVFFVPGEGQLISPVVPELIRRLQADALSPQESKELFYTFFTDCQPSLARYLVERYPGKNLRFPLIDDPDFVAKNFEFFMRYYNPDEFREVVPNFSLVGE